MKEGSGVSSAPTSCVNRLLVQTRKVANNRKSWLMDREVGNWSVIHDPWPS